MDRTAFVVVTTIILMLAFAAGWFTYWVLHRFTHVAGGDLGEMDHLAQSLHEAEELRDQAIVYMEQREAELQNQLHQAEAELRAAMDGLRDARRETEDLRNHIARLKSTA